MKSVNRATIDRMNADFHALVEQHGTYDAACRVAAKHGFVERINDETCVVFSKGEDVVNCWIDNVADFGFDDQWDWCNERFEGGLAPSA